MITPKDILKHLRDQDFTEEELESLMKDMVKEQREDAANRSLAKFLSDKRNFVNKRNKRIRQELFDVISEWNSDRREIKLLKAQDMYKENRKKKKQAKYDKARQV